MRRSRFTPLLAALIAVMATLVGGLLLAMAPRPAAADGTTWTSRTAPDRGWSAVTYGNNTFVAVSWGGEVMSSTDGITWTEQTTPEDARFNEWNSVTYGNGTFVAVSSRGTHRVMTSPDGITWTAHEAPLGHWWSVTYGNGRFVAVADGTSVNGAGWTPVLMTSSNGEDWTAIRTTEDEELQPASYSAVAYGNGVFVAVVELDYDTEQILRSTDGLTWEVKDAVDWTETVGDNGTKWTSIAFGNGQFVAVSYQMLVNGSGFASNRVMTSPDGATWTAQTGVSSDWRSVTWAGDKFVAVGTFSRDEYAHVQTSPDGVTWTERTPATTAGWWSVTSGDGMTVAVAYSGKVMTSGSITPPTTTSTTTEAPPTTTEAPPTTAPPTTTTPPAPTRPSPPVINLVRGDEQTTAYITVTHDGGSPVASYQARCVATGKRGGPAVLSDPTPTPRIVIGDLDNGTRYRCSARVANDVGWSAWSKHRRIGVSTEPPQAPRAPRIVDATATSDTVDVIVEKHDRRRGGTISAFQVRCTDGDTVVESTPSRSTTHTVAITGLGDDATTTWSCAARASNAVGWSTWSVSVAARAI